jgi:hypothetical protein
VRTFLDDLGLRICVYIVFAYIVIITLHTVYAHVITSCTHCVCFQFHASALSSKHVHSFTLYIYIYISITLCRKICLIVLDFLQVQLLTIK